MVNFKEFSGALLYFFPEMPGCLPGYFFKKLGEVGWIVGEYVGNFRDGLICFSQHFLRGIDNFSIIKMTGMMPHCLLDSSRKMRVRHKHGRCNLVQLHKMRRISTNHICDMFI